MLNPQTPLWKTSVQLDGVLHWNNPINTFWMFSIDLFPFHSRTQSHLFLLHRSPLWVPQQRDWSCHEPLHQSRLAVDAKYSRKYPSLPFPESSSLFQDWLPIKRGFWHCTCNLPNCFHMIFLFRLFTKRIQNRFHQQNLNDFTLLTNSPTSRLRQAPCLLNPQTHLCIALEQSYKHFLNVLNRSLPVPQSYAELIPASSMTSVSSSAKGLVMPRAFTRVRARNQHQIFKQTSIFDIHQNPSRSAQIGLHSSIEIAVSPTVFIWSSSLTCSRNTFRIVSNSVRLFMSSNVVRISGFIQFISQTPCASFSK